MIRVFVFLSFVWLLWFLSENCFQKQRAEPWKKWKNSRRGIEPVIRRTLLACWIALTMSLASQAGAQQDIAATASQAAQVSGPNILLLIAEDMSARVGAFDDPVAITPNLDELARQGVRFPNTFTTAGVCAPSRAALIMGMYQTSFGAHHMRTSSFAGAAYLTVPPAEVKAFPELLRAAGYYTFTSNKLDYQVSNGAPKTGPASRGD